MRRLIYRLLPVCLAAAVLLLPAAARADVRDLLPFGRTYRIAKLLPAVVNITMVKLVQDESGSGGEVPAPRRVDMVGSGFLIDPSGIIVTNKHVVSDVIEINVTLQSGRTLPAKVMAVAGNIDLALLKVDADKPLPVVKWGDSDRLHIGDQVLAVGNPLGVGESVSAGIISGLNRNIKISPFDSFIQTDAAINHGNSGGPLVDMHGDVVGVDTALFSPTDSGGSVGIGFAIPANEARFVIDQLRRLGRLQLGWLGVNTQDVTVDIADSVGLARPRGVLVASLDKDGPAAKADIREGDVILAFAGQTPRDGRALAWLVARAKIGGPASMNLWRDGREITVSVTPGEWLDKTAPVDTKPVVPARAPSTDPMALGLQLEPVTSDMRSKLALPADAAGVLVAGVQPNSTASDRAFVAGDVILRVQQAPVGNAEEVRQGLVDANNQHRRHALVLVRRGDGQRWITLPVGSEGSTP